MGAYYTIIIVFLFFLAVSLLIIGVSNDAVNFLNSALGCKAAPFGIILAIAGVGVLLGAVFSNGMMEVARKGIFNPEYFAFDNIMVIFLSVMLTNILLLDFFNTVGLPTSTTISIVFGLLGAAVAVAVLKITSAGQSIENIENYINIEGSVMIIAGIFLSVAIAFSAGILVQWIVRLAFSFNVAKTYKFWSGIWGGFSITAILFFLIIKGAKGSTLISGEMLEFIKYNTLKILIVSFAGWTIILQLLVMFTRINILKITVLAGTFALAMAFAGNDLVNFIGVPLAGFESYKSFINAGSPDAGSYMMNVLSEPVNTPLIFLISSGVIMVLTLRFSKKAKSVTATTLDLSRQDEGSERFASSSMARFIVRRSINLGRYIEKITPRSFSIFINKRFNPVKNCNGNNEEQAFDLVRASVNLVVASILIAIGTSLKLPLSTTYVTFMVTMGTSFADGAWGRDSAVYRITGVLTVIGGWLFTAFSAFVLSCLFAVIVYYGKLPVVILFIGLSVLYLVKSNLTKTKDNINSKNNNDKEIKTSPGILVNCDDKVNSFILRISDILYKTYEDFLNNKHNELRKHRKELRKLSDEISCLSNDIPCILRKFEENDLESGHHYVEIVSYMKESCNCLLHVIQPAVNHLKNNYSSGDEQLNKIKEFNIKSCSFMLHATKIVEGSYYDELSHLSEKRDEIINMINDILLYRIKILKKTQRGVTVSITYMDMLSETKNLLLNITELVKADAKLHCTLDEQGRNITQVTEHQLII